MKYFMLNKIVNINSFEISYSLVYYYTHFDSKMCFNKTYLSLFFIFIPSFTNNSGVKLIDIMLKN